MNSVWFLAGLALAGIGLIIAGAAWKQVILSSLGGSLFGTAVGSLLSIKGNRSALDEVRSGNQAILEAMRIGVESDFRSDESKISRFRRHWHSYHVTRKGGRFVWHHSELDFTKLSPPGVLYCETLQTDEDGKMIKYHVTAGLRDTRLILFFKGEEIDEPAAIAVYPYAGFYLRDRHCGLRVHLTWDRTDSISRGILSKTPIKDATQIGDVSDNVAVELDKIWEDEFRRHDTFRSASTLPNT